MVPEQLAQWREELKDKTPRNIVRWATALFGKKLVQGTGLGSEDQVITHLLADSAPEADIVFVDTGRHFQQTHELLQETNTHYGLDIRIHFPNGESLEQMLAEDGPNLFHKSVALRRSCCAVRKHDPLKRALAPYDAWLSGHRRRQGPEREELEVISYDEVNQLVRINPLWNWDDKQLWDFVRLNGVPTHDLHQQGYAYPACAPCARALKPGEAPCAGRWWWEGEDQSTNSRAQTLCV